MSISDFNITESNQVALKIRDKDLKINGSIKAESNSVKEHKRF